jgi:hypothetical protein
MRVVWVWEGRNVTLVDRMLSEVVLLYWFREIFVGLMYGLSDSSFAWRVWDVTAAREEAGASEGPGITGLCLVMM